MFGEGLRYVHLCKDSSFDIYSFLHQYPGTESLRTIVIFICYWVSFWLSRLPSVAYYAFEPTGPIQRTEFVHIQLENFFPSVIDKIGNQWHICLSLVIIFSGKASPSIIENGNIIECQMYLENWGLSQEAMLWIQGSLLFSRWMFWKLRSHQILIPNEWPTLSIENWTACEGNILYFLVNWGTAKIYKLWISSGGPS